MTCRRCHGSALARRRTPLEPAPAAEVGRHMHARERTHACGGTRERGTGSVRSASGGSSHEALPPEILEGALAHDVALDVLALHVLIWPEGLLLCILLQLVVERDRILDLRDLLEVRGVGDLQTPHAEGMSPLREVTLEGPAAPIGVVATDFALVFDAQAVQLVEPERDRLAIPAQGQVQRVVDGPVLVVLLHVRAVHVRAVVVLLLGVQILLGLHLLGCLTLLLLQVGDRLIDGVPEQVVPLGGPTLQPRHAPVLLLHGLDKLLLVLEAKLLHLLNLLLIQLAGLVRLNDGRVVEELVGGQAEEFLLVGGVLPAGDALVGPSLVELLVELRLQLLDANHGLSAEQETTEVRDDAIQVVRVQLLLVLAISRDLVELVEALEPFDVVELSIFLRKGLLDIGVVGREARVLLLEPREAGLLGLRLPVGGDLLEVDEGGEDRVHVHALAHLLLAREQRVALVGLEGALEEPPRILEFGQARVDVRASVVVLHILDLVVEASPDVALLLVAALARQGVDVVAPHAVFVGVDVYCRPGLGARGLHEVVQGMLHAHRVPAVLGLLHEDKAHSLLDVLRILVRGAQRLQNREAHRD
mmetsp:Transcript_10826/g.28814  ORF Transcript_10826/g.28814 Transcript_10826/m.28814 type:complete len:589 (+) Transcript_10826:23-1789(+)